MHDGLLAEDGAQAVGEGHDEHQPGPGFAKNRFQGREQSVFCRLQV